MTSRLVLGVGNTTFGVGGNITIIEAGERLPKDHAIVRANPDHFKRAGS